MDPIDKFLKLYSYKFPKGYPDMNDEQDILLLENILQDLNIILEQPVAKENLSKGIEILKKELKLTDEYFPLVSSTRAKVLVPNSERPKFNEILSNIEGFTKNKDNEFKFENVTFLIKPIEKNPIMVDGELSTTKADTDIKEGLVVVFYDLVSRGIPFESFSTKQEELNLAQLEQIPNGVIEDVDKALGSGVADKVNNWLNMAKSKPTDSTVVKALNNAYSIGNVLGTTYPESRAIRDERFNNIRKTAQELTGLEQDKWNPGDIYLYHGEEDLTQGTKDAREQKSINPINDLFNDEWGATINPLTAISLKDEKAQPGRAKSYVARYGKLADGKGDIIKSDDINQIQNLIDQQRNEIKKLNGKEFGGVKIKYSFKDTNNPENLKTKRRKLASLELLNFLASQGGSNPIPVFLGIFAFGEGLDQEKRANPTFFKLTGKDKGLDPALIKSYPRGASVQFVENSEFEIIDSLNSGGVTMVGNIQVNDQNPYELRKSIRTSSSNPLSPVGIT